METDRPLRIKDLEKISGVSRSTIHYYVREGLLSPPRKTGKTMAYYDARHVQELEEIRSMQANGYPISYIKEMLGSEKSEGLEGRTGAGEIHRSDRRQQIMDKAVEIFARKGYHQTNVTEIARAAGVGHSTFYIYFPSKMALFAECVDRVFQEMFAGVWEEIKGEKNPLARIKKRGEAVLKSYPQFIDMMSVLKSIEEDDPALEAKKREIYLSVVETVKRDLERATEMGLIPETDIEVAAYIIVGFLESAWLLMSMNEDYSVDYFMEVADGLVFPHVTGAVGRKSATRQTRMTQKSR